MCVLAPCLRVKNMCICAYLQANSSLAFSDIMTSPLSAASSVGAVNTVTLRFIRAMNDPQFPVSLTAGTTITAVVGGGTGVASGVASAKVCVWLYLGLGACISLCGRVRVCTRARGCFCFRACVCLYMLMCSSLCDFKCLCPCGCRQ